MCVCVIKNGLPPPPFFYRNIYQSCKVVIISSGGAGGEDGRLLMVLHLISCLLHTSICRCRCRCPPFYIYPPLLCPLFSFVLHSPPVSLSLSLSLSFSLFLSSSLYVMSPVCCIRGFAAATAATCFYCCWRAKSR